MKKSLIVFIMALMSSMLCGQTVTPKAKFVNADKYNIIEFQELDDTIYKGQKFPLRTNLELVSMLLQVSSIDDMEKLTLDTLPKLIRVNGKRFTALNESDSSRFVAEYWMKISYKGDEIGLLVGQFFPAKLTMFEARDLVIMKKKNDKWFKITLFELTSLNLFMVNTKGTIIDSIIESKLIGELKIDKMIEEFIGIENENMFISPDMFRYIIHDLVVKKEENKALLEQMLISTGEIIKVY